MKKFIVAILALLYLGVSSGIAMEIHYCMGKKSGVEFYGKENDKCGKCGMKDKKGCCSDEHKFYKLADAHKNIANTLDFTAGEIALLTVYPVYQCSLIADADKAPINNHSPPLYTKPSACILHCVFRL